MSRRAANITQADVARALRAAQQAGPSWRIEIDGGIIRMVQGPPPAASDPSSALPQDALAPEEKWRL
ncbi:MAG TPA: hypothetical protein VKG78_11150 [Opitutaceae bacterium]|nr:hypothetical protein [Opitutaceae bacterium]